MLQINHMIGKILMNLDNLKNIIEQSQRTQRNWDLNKSVKEEDIELFKTAVSHCPTKQNRVWYNVVIIKIILKNNMIKYIYNSTLLIGFVKKILKFSTIIYYNSL